ncbi:hypothetical protein TNIN_34761 [Trichonephila inaurata madagascariensis]|uniref:Uncharacterized protein n=1 Tax=Trichonephila inaurata madagascariensis TaxID=2747483 RepID=A0A8X6WYJ4_9ARAC|nr:hypothetical protein TNIN_34761 [Trichonephila inaurata madagascariensis]
MERTVQINPNDRSILHHRKQPIIMINLQHSSIDPADDSRVEEITKNQQQICPSQTFHSIHRKQSDVIMRKKEPETAYKNIKEGRKKNEST